MRVLVDRYPWVDQFDPGSAEGRLAYGGPGQPEAGAAGAEPGRAGDTLQATQPTVLGAAAIVLLAAFVVREKKAKAPLLDLGLLKDRGIAGANLTVIAVGAFSAAQVLLVTLYLQEGRGLSPVLTGVCFVPQAAGAFSLAGPAGRFVPALGPRRALAIALLIALAALAGAALAVAVTRQATWSPDHHQLGQPGGPGKSSEPDDARSPSRV